MKSVLTTMCAAIVCSAAVAMAQAPAYDKPQADKKITDSTVVVTGCVADKNANGQYLLTNAVKADATAMAKDTAAPPTAAPPTAATGTSGTSSFAPKLSYELFGGENLQAHLGHKVEITGTIDASDVDKMAKTEDKKPETGAPGMSDKDVKAPKLKITSVKMIAAVCP